MSLLTSLIIAGVAVYSISNKRKRENKNDIVIPPSENQEKINKQSSNSEPEIGEIIYSTKDGIRKKPDGFSEFLKSITKFAPSYRDLFDRNVSYEDFKGSAGEMEIERIIQRNNDILPGEVYRNVYVPKPNGETSEVDLVFITKKGIFVIESKNYYGYVSGSKNKEWNVSLFDRNGNVYKYKFYNPICQNTSHIYYLRKFLKNQKCKIYSVVAFSDESKIKYFGNLDKDIFLINYKDIYHCMYNEWSSLPDNLSKNEVEEITKKLEPLTEVSKEVKKSHIEAIQKHKDLSEVCKRKYL